MTLFIKELSDSKILLLPGGGPTMVFVSKVVLISKRIKPQTSGLSHRKDLLMQIISHMKSFDFRPKLLCYGTMSM